MVISNFLMSPLAQARAQGTRPCWAPSRVLDMDALDDRRARACSTRHPPIPPCRAPMTIADVQMESHPSG